MRRGWLLLLAGLLAGCTWLVQLDAGGLHVAWVDFPTPTQERAEGGKCLVRLGEFAINERVAPRLDAPLTEHSPIPAGSVVAVSEFTQADGYLWAHDAFGWFAVRAGDTWWVTFVAGTAEQCPKR